MVATECPNKAIRKGAFAGGISLKEIIIPDYVQTIEPKAFMRCANLESLYIDKAGNVCVLNYSMLY
ncbi:MAG: leucine-rich repeat protein [Parasporobacterium sp.]|nr:leucine-rich repeat protein [Parasporobacterium sp.]